MDVCVFMCVTVNATLSNADKQMDEEVMHVHAVHGIVWLDGAKQMA